jgi:hypothetical protein
MKALSLDRDQTGLTKHRGNRCFPAAAGYAAGDAAALGPNLCNELKWSGTSPKFLMTFAPPIACRGNAGPAVGHDADMSRHARDSPSARMTTAVGMKHSVGSPATIASSAATKGSATKYVSVNLFRRRADRPESAILTPMATHPRRHFALASSRTRRRIVAITSSGMSLSAAHSRADPNCDRTVFNRCRMSSPSTA